MVRVIFFLIPLFGAIVAIVMGTMVFVRNAKKPVNIVYFLLSAAIAFWAFCEFEVRSAGTEEKAAFWNDITVTWPLAGALMLHFSLIFTEQKRLLHSWLTYVVIYIPAFTWFYLHLATDRIPVVMTREYWGWTYASNISALNDVMITIVIGMGLTAVFFCFRYFLAHENPSRQRAASRYVLIGVAYPVAVGALSEGVPSLLGLKIPPMTTASFAFGSVVFIGYAMWRYELFSLTPEKLAGRIISTMSDSLFVVNPDGIIEAVNESSERMLGYRRSEMIGLKIEDIFWPDERPDAICRKIIDDPSVMGIEAVDATLESKSHEAVDVSLSCATIKDRDGACAGVICVGRDERERKKAHDALMRSESKLREAQKVARLGSWELDRETGEIEASDELFEIFGLEPNAIKLTLESVTQIIHPDDRDQFVQAYEQMFQKGAVVGLDLRIIRADGEVRYVREERQPLKEQESLGRYFMGTVQDVTEQKEAQLALAESEAMYRNIINASPDAIAESDLDGNVLLLSQRAADMYGYDSIEEMKQKNIRDFVAPTQREEAARVMKQVLTDGFLRNIEGNSMRKDGSVFPVEMSAVLVLDADGKPKSVISIIRDVTDRKLVEAEIEKMTEDLSLVNSLNEAGNRGDTVEEIIALTAGEIKGIFSSRSVLTLSDDGDGLRIVKMDIPLAKANMIERITEAPVRELESTMIMPAGSTYGQIFRSGRAQFINGVASVERCMAEFTGSTAARFSARIRGVLGISAVMVLPVKVRDKPLFLLCVARDGFFMNSDLSRAVAIIDHLSLILDRIAAEEDLTASREMLRAQYKSIPIPTYTWRRIDHDFELIDFNEAAKAESGSLLAPAKGVCAGDFFSGNPEAAELLGQCYSSQNIIRRELNLTTEKGEGRLFDCALAYVTPDMVLTHIEDVTKRRLAERKIKQQSLQLATQNSELAALYEISRAAAESRDMDSLMSSTIDAIDGIAALVHALPQLGIFLIEGDKMRLAADSGFHGTDFRRKHNGMKVGDCLCGISAATGKLIYSENSDRDVRHTIADSQVGPHGHIIVPLTVMGGKAVGVLYMYLPVGADAPDERRKKLLQSIGGRLGVAIENMRLQEKTRELSLHDPLTGLGNRRLMSMELRKGMAFAKRSGRPMSILLLDLDHFKQYNDMYGHSSGDVLLADLALIMKKEIREMDLAVRYGGEEFLIILPETDILAASEVAERIRERVAASEFDCAPGQTSHITVSLGIAVCDGGVNDENVLVKRADAALYTAKSNGRNRVESWNEAMGIHGTHKS